MDSIQKFQELLKKLFQFETSDLDFGIYRILNYKRGQIEDFIQKDLKNKVESAFSKYKDERLDSINQRFEEAKQKVIQGLGTQAFTPAGKLKEEFKDTPLGKDFLSIKAQKNEAETIDEIKLQVFNDLYSFFSRYYEEGDFVPQYRYSIKGHKYAIPYNGEEVKLYWANNEQYYTKTGLLFRDYTFKADPPEADKVVFRIVSAREELGSNKATKERFFILDDERPVENVIASPSLLCHSEHSEESHGVQDKLREAISRDKSIIISFQYRELTEEEVKSYGVEGGSNTAKQEKINQKSYEVIIKKVGGTSLKALLSQERKPVSSHVLSKAQGNGKGNEKPLLLYQISRFTAKNTKDYFIHKNLKKFLSEQLDYFIKAEVLDIETLEKERFLDKHITRAKVVREIGENIIDFLSQIEDFQKKLWEKKKFVLKTEYVITIDRIFLPYHSDPERSEGEESLKYFYDEIFKNKNQKKEWEELGFEIPKTKQDLKERTLPIDTKYFSQEFKEKLLEKLTEGHPERSEGSHSDEAIPLDDQLDGILIKSENWQALNLLLGKYRENVKCIYIDPPYNSTASIILYKNNYLHSSWMSLIGNRLQVAYALLTKNGLINIAIDDNEFRRLHILCDEIFGAHNHIGNIAIMNNPKGRAKEHIASCHDYNVVYSISKIDAVSSKFVHTEEELHIKYPELDKKGRYRELPLRRTGSGSLRQDRPKMWFPIYFNTSLNQISLIKGDGLHWVEIFPFDSDRIERRWLWGPKKVQEALQEEELIVRQSGNKYTVYYKDRLDTEYDVKSLWYGERHDSSTKGTNLLKDMLGDKIFDYPKSLYTVTDVISFAADGNSIILDFFAGSGTTAHAVMYLNKEDGGKRKYILVEMANYFDTVMIPRLKKICYSFNWKDGKPQDTDGISQFFKYQILEQYEDTLDNIGLTPNKQAELVFGDDYLLKYFLDYEARGNPSLLNIDRLKNPFSYKLKVNLEEAGEPQEMTVDIPETFNYLLGLKVKKIKAREIASPAARTDKKEVSLRGSATTEAISKRKYLFVLGEKDGKDMAIVWREYDDSWNEDDFKKDKEFIIKELATWAPALVYINGQSVVTPELGKLIVEIRYIELEFKKLMERELA